MKHRSPSIKYACAVINHHVITLLSILCLIHSFSCSHQHRLCNNTNDFLFQAKFSYFKLVKRGYKHNLLLKYLKRFCSAYNIEGKYGEKNSDLLFSRMLKHNPFVSCNINDIKEISDIVKASYIRIMPLTKSLECEWINKSPLPTIVFDTVNASLLLIHWI